MGGFSDNNQSQVLKWKRLLGVEYSATLLVYIQTMLVWKKLVYNVWCAFVAPLGSALFMSVCPDRVRAGAAQWTTTVVSPASHSPLNESHMEELSSPKIQMSLQPFISPTYIYTDWCIYGGADIQWIAFSRETGTNSTLWHKYLNV